MTMLEYRGKSRSAVPMCCADCRIAWVHDTHDCANCGWMPKRTEHFEEWLSSKDRTSSDFADYALTYDTLADRYLTRAVESMSYVSSLAAGCIRQLPDLKGKSVCDIGSGRGFFVKMALEAGASSVVAVDVASPALAAVVQNHSVTGVMANAENLPFDRAFDVIVATDIIEHVLNVPNFLVTANWALKDNGYLLIRAPYLENMLGYSNFFGLPMHYTHLRTYDRTLLVHDVESAGYKLEKVFYDGFRADYTARFWSRFPWLEKKLQSFLQRRYHLENVTALPQWLARLLMKPIEIGVVVRKVNHIQAVRYHDDLRAYHERRKSSHINNADAR